MRTSGDEIEIWTTSEKIRKRRWRAIYCMCCVWTPAESRHWLNLGTRRKEDQRAAEGDIRKNCRGREAEDGFCHLE